MGGGPAGLAVAIAALQAGLEAVVVDQASPPIDKACGEGLMPGGSAWLRTNGVEVNPDGVSPFIGIHYLDTTTGVTAEGDFPHGPGQGIRRLHLQQALVNRAEALGADLRWKTRATGLLPEGLQLENGTLDADHIIGCDGLHSSVRRWAGIDVKWASWQRWGVRRHFAIPPWSRHVEVHWADGCEAYVTPAGPNRVGVALLWSGQKARFETLMARFPELQAKLNQAPFDSAARGTGPFRHRVSTVARPPVFLVGDSSGYVDALTGEGLSLAFHQADALVAALVDGDPARYARDHARITRVYRWTTGLLLVAARRPWLRRRVIRALSAEPVLFGLLLGLNDGVIAPTALPPLSTLRFAGRVLLG